jgi:hypothetical protein
LAFLGKNRLDNDAQTFGQILELADVIGSEGLVAHSTPPNRNLRRRGCGVWWIKDLVELPDLVGRQGMWGAASGIRQEILFSAFAHTGDC